jgi:hypothetical protein
MALRRCKIHYRKLRREQNEFPDTPLSAKISEAMDSRVADGVRLRSRVRERLALVPKQLDYQRLLNNFHEEHDLFFGDMCLFSPGELQAFLALRG